MVKVKIDPNRFWDALNAFAKDSKKSWETLFTQQCKLIGKQIVMVTPPMQANRLGKDTFATGKSRGQAATASDILKVFVSTRSKKTNDGRKVVDSLSEMAQVHKRQKNRRGRVGGKAREIPALGGVLKQYIAQKKKSVGYLASGWNALKVAAKFGGIPKWITDKDAGGGATIASTGDTLKFIATNNASFAGNLRGVERYMQIAVDQQAINLWRQVKKRQEQLQARMTQRTKAKK
jgi:hypothetical protein